MADKDTTLATFVERAGGTYPLEALGLPGSPSTELLLRRIGALREEANKTAAPPAVHERLAQVEALARNPLECFIHLRSQAMRLDPADAQARAPLEASYLELELPKAVWSIIASRGRSSLRDSARQTVLCAIEIEARDGKQLTASLDNLSRSGVALSGIAAEPREGGEATIRMKLPGSERVLTAKIRVAWRHQDRAGAEMRELSKADLETIDIFLRSQFLGVRALAERYLKIAPVDPQAIACAGLCRFFSSTNPAEEKAAIDYLTDAATKAQQSMDIHLALARTSMEAGILDRARRALRRAEEINKNDPRLPQMKDALGSSRARHGERLSIGDVWDAIVGGPRQRLVIGIGSVVTALVFAGIYVPLSMRSPLQETAVPQTPKHLPCVEAKVGKGILTCVVDAAIFQAIPPAQREDRARTTSVHYASKGIRRIIVFSREKRFLQMFDETVKLPTPKAGTALVPQLPTTAAGVKAPKPPPPPR